MRTTVNFQTKEALINAVKAGRKIGVYSSNGDIFCPTTIRAVAGRYTIHGPYGWNASKQWSAVATVKNRVIVKVE